MPQLLGLPVLVIDDDAASAKLMSVVLEEEGSSVRAVRSAEDALEVLPTFQPRAIILDLLLPLMSGLLLTQQLRARPEMKDVVIIAVTSVNGPEARKLALQAGCNAYVQKPIDVAAITRLLREHLGGAP